MNNRRRALTLILTGFSAVSIALTTSTTERREEVNKGAKPCTIQNLPRPFVLLTRDQLNDLRQSMESPGTQRQIYTEFIKPNVQRWINRDIVIPERAGHYHHFTCDDGTRLPVSSDQFIGVQGPYKCPECGREYSGEKYDGGRRNAEHVWLLNAARDLALEYALKGDTKAASKSAEILLKYADAYPGRHTKPTLGGSFYQSLDESMYIIVLAQAYDLIYDAGVLTDDQKRHVEEDLFWECAEGLIKVGIGGNWGSWHLSAVGVIGYATKHQRYIDYGINSFKSQITNQLGEDGLWPESVHTYHFFPMRGFLYLAEAAFNSGIDLYTWSAGPKRSLHSMFTEPLQYMYPNFQLPAINDGWYASYLPVDMYEVASTRYHTDGFEWVVQELLAQDVPSRNGTPNFETAWRLVHSRNVGQQSTPPEFRSTHFPVLGICTLRLGKPLSDEVMMTFDYGKFFGHGQADRMGVTLFAENRVMVPDYGTPSYGSAILPYYTGTTSHNTIVIDGKRQDRGGIPSLITFKNSSEISIACAKTSDTYRGVNWRRTVALTEEFALVHDSLVSEQEHQFDSLIRCNAEQIEFQGLAKAAEALELKLDYLTSSVAYTSIDEDTNMQFRWKFEDAAGLHLQALSTSGTLAYIAQCPSETGTRTVPVVALRQKGTKAEFLQLLVPFQKFQVQDFQLKESPEGIVIKTETKAALLNTKSPVPELRFIAAPQ